MFGIDGQRLPQQDFGLIEPTEFPEVRRSLGFQAKMRRVRSHRLDKCRQSRGAITSASCKMSHLGQHAGVLRLLRKRLPQ